MGKRDMVRPTNSELAILRVLWKQGPSTVRQVQEVLSTDKPTGYTTVLKLMQLMLPKGLLERDERNRTHIYRTSVAAEKMQRQLVGDFVQRVFNGSAEKLVMQALSSEKISKKELTQIRTLLDEIERGER